MKSGLEGRNNILDSLSSGQRQIVSMKSGLEGRNNLSGGGVVGEW